MQSSFAGAVAAGFPAIVPSSVFGATAPSNRISIGAIGVGRISRVHDMPGVLQFTGVAGRDNRIVAVCDLSPERVELGKQFVNDAYTKKLGSAYTGTRGYSDYKELLANKEIDAVLISTPDHQHARLAVAAVAAGKDVYLQKPASLTISEGRIMANRVEASRQILQVGSQQRSWKQFARAVELVRNGRIGTVQRVEIGLPGDPSGGNPQPMPVPAGFNYDAWLGSTPEVPYTVDRVMPQTGFDRPGWLRMEQFGAGMITGWGAHHVDTAHWGMDTELTGPVEIWGQAQFPTEGLWNVHGPFKTYGRYANGVVMTISGDFENGIKWIGDKGWIFVCRDTGTTPTSSFGSPALTIVPLRASDP
jgi:predicted dehydrogenase